MLAVIGHLNFIINIAWFLIIASAIFSWLYAFNVINVNNPRRSNMIGRSLYQLTEPLYRPIRACCPTWAASTFRACRAGDPLFHPALPEHHHRSCAAALRRCRHAWRCRLNSFVRH